MTPDVGYVVPWAIAYGNGEFVAATDGGYTLTSVDGFNWIAHREATNAPLYGVTEGSLLVYGDGQFIAMNRAGTNTSVQVSGDGVAWSKPVTLLSASSRAVTYANGKFIGVGASGSGSGLMAISSDGTNWSTQQFSSPLNDVATGNGVTVAVSTSGTMVSSTDSVHWTENSVLPGTTIVSVVYGNGGFIAQTPSVAVYNTNYPPLYTNIALISTNGTSWSKRGMSYGGERHIVFGDGLYVGLGGYYGCLGFVSSTNGLDWPSAFGACPARYTVGATSIGFGAGTLVVAGSEAAPTFWVFSPTYLLSASLVSTDSVNLMVSGGGIGQHVRLQTAFALPATNWVDLFTFTNTCPTNFLDTSRSSYPQRFYRVVSP